MAKYLGARTKFFDHVVINAINRRTAQVVIAGAGYDGRSLRFATPGVNWFEVDQLATQSDKRERLGRLGITTPNTHFVAADFRFDDVSKELLENNFVSTLPTLFICEGVTVYLEMVVLERLLENLRMVAAPGSELSISFSVEAVTSRRQRKFDRRVGELGEPALNHLSVAESEHLLEGAGWRLKREFSEGGCFARARRAGFIVATTDS